MNDKNEEERLLSLRKEEMARAIRWFKKDVKRWEARFDNIGHTGMDMITRLIPQYRSAQDKMREMFAGLDMCRGCGKCCCYKYESYMKFADYVILRIEGIGIPEFHMPKEIGKERVCIFMKKEGCAFPNDLRLETCVTYACNEMYHKLRSKRKMKKFENLRDNVKSISCAIDDLARIIDIKRVGG